MQLAEFGEGKILRLRLNLAGDGRADGGQLLHAGRQKHDVHHAAVVFVMLTIDIARLEQAIHQRRDVLSFFVRFLAEKRPKNAECLIINTLYL